jgi:hypothetical protein
MAAMLFHERRITRCGVATEVGHRDRGALQKRRCGHPAELVLRALWRNRQQHVEQRPAQR